MHGIQLLLNGKLPHQFVGHQNLQDGITKLDRFLNMEHPHLTVLYKNSRHYYLNSKFSISRRDGTLIILIDCPLTIFKNSLMIYHLQVIPLLTPGTKNHYTVLTENIYGLAYHRDENYYMIISQQSQIQDNPIDLRSSSLQLLDRRRYTCPLVLIEGNLEDI
jgi:hypothetical protein